jgi:enamine deaminase RidA (YjgF/YER057c/UK114 family)
MSKIQRYPNTSGLPLSRAIRAGDFLLLSGQIPVDENGQVVRGDIASQTHAVLKRIGETLALAGASYADVVRATVWLADIGDFAAFNEVYRSDFRDGFPTGPPSKRSSPSTSVSRSRCRPGSAPSTKQETS